ncbi:MAG: hypothetical protein KGH56_02860 [Patescibacteria group bacterium]|nr:hypothetical protein [Patescibacteria group bacterium]
MRSRTSLFLALLFAGSLTLPSFAHAGGIPFFGPVIPESYVSSIGPTQQDTSSCPASWGMLIEVINNLISLLLTLAIVFVAPVMIAYSGFLFVVNPVNPSGKQEAKNILTHTVVGIVVALAGWMIVDMIMAVLYNSSAQSENGVTVLGTWSNLISSGGIAPCLPVRGALPYGTLNQAAAPASINVAPPPSTPFPVLPSMPPSGKAGTACDPAVISAGAAAGGYTLTPAQATTLACIAQPESSCGAANLNYKWSKGSSAAGAFQVTLQSNSKCYENPACYSAVGLSGSSLNCASGFKGGNPIPGSPVAQQCVQAASNINCSAAAAACLLQQNGGSFSPWQASSNSTKQTSCITGGM